jgi:hypothetical protein
MPGGTHVAMNEFSIASCLSTASIEGNARIQVLAMNLSKVNEGFPRGNDSSTFTPALRRPRSDRCQRPVR